MRGIVFYTVMEEQMPVCAYQFFSKPRLDANECEEMIKLATIYSENFGPVIAIVSDAGYEYLVRNGFDEVYIDILICENEEDVTQFAQRILCNEQGDKPPVINNIQECGENLRILYNQFPDNHPIMQVVRDAIKKENSLNALL